MNGQYKKQRLFISGIYTFLFFITLIVVWCLRDRIFYGTSNDNIWDLWRLVWLLPYICLGLALRAYAMRDHPEPAKYVFGIAYPLFGIAGACIAFGVLHAIDGTSGWLYYPLSASIIFLLSCDPHKILELKP